VTALFGLHPEFDRSQVRFVASTRIIKTLIKQRGSRYRAEFAERHCWNVVLKSNKLLEYIGILMYIKCISRKGAGENRAVHNFMLKYITILGWTRRNNTDG
jgi:hypothetical protein